MVINLPVRGCQFHGGAKDEHGFLKFCGKPAKEEYSYCGEHVRRIYQRSTVSYGPKAPVEVPAEAVVEAVEIVPVELEREAA